MKHAFSLEGPLNGIAAFGFFVAANVFQHLLQRIGAGFAVACMKQKALIVHGVDGNQSQQNATGRIFKLKNKAVLSKPDILSHFSLQLGQLDVFVDSHVANVHTINLNTASSLHSSIALFTFGAPPHYTLAPQEHDWRLQYPC